MKINGKTFTGAFVKPVVFPRGDDRIVFKVQAILDYEEFEKLCPRPQAPMIKPLNGPERPDLKDEEYLKALNEYSLKNTDYLLLKSLQATEGLEWDNVDYNNPDTWKNWRQDLRSAGLTEMEVVHLLNEAIAVNGLDPEKIKQATEDFLREVPQE